MNLIILHGPPASGKYSIAKELESIIGSKTFHNHLPIDVVKPVMEFGSDEFFKVIDEIRFTCLSAFSMFGPGTLVMTWCFDSSYDLEFYKKIEKLKLSIQPVFLKCDTEELEKRVVQDSRAKLGKLNTVEGLRECVKKWNIDSIPRENCIVLNTNNKTPIESARELVNIIKADNKLSQQDASKAGASA